MKSIKKTQTAWSGRKRTTLIGVCVAGVMLPLDVTVVGVALDSIGRDLEASFARLQGSNVILWGKRYSDMKAQKK